MVSFDWARSVLTGSFNGANGYLTRVSSILASKVICNGTCPDPGAQPGPCPGANSRGSPCPLASPCTEDCRCTWADCCL